VIAKFSICTVSAVFSDQRRDREQASLVQAAGEPVKS